MPTTITWKQNLSPFTHDPDEVEDYEFDFTDWLEGESLVGASCTVTGSGVTAEKHAVVGDNITARVSEGTVGSVGTVTVHAVSDTGREADRSIRFIVRER